MSVDGWDFSITERLAASRDRALSPVNDDEAVDLHIDMDAIIQELDHLQDVLTNAVKQMAPSLNELVSNLRLMFENFAIEIRDIFDPFTIIQDDYNPPTWTYEWWELQHAKQLESGQNVVATFLESDRLYEWRIK